MYHLTYSDCVALLTLASVSGCVGGSAPASAVPKKPSIQTTSALNLSENLQDCSTPHVATEPLRQLTQSEYLTTVDALLPHANNFNGAAVNTFTIPPDEVIAWFAGSNQLEMTESAASSLRDAAEALATSAAWNLYQNNTPNFTLPCVPLGAGDTDCATMFITQFGQRAFRRPLADSEVSVYTSLFTQYAVATDDLPFDPFTQGVRVVIEAMLQAPDFLYHVELVGPVDPSDVFAANLDDFSMASRLAFFIWGSMPDDALLDAAASGALHDPNALRLQAQRLLSDPRGGQLITSYFTQILNISEISSVSKDGGTFPFFSVNANQIAFVTAAVNDTLGLADRIIRQTNGSFDELLTSTDARLDDPLFGFYGVAYPDGFQTGNPAWVQLDPTQRSGLLTRVAYLYTQAHTNQTSPVARGKYIRMNFLCQPLPPPPATVNANLAPPSPNETTRQLLAMHETNASCAGCHTLMDPIGVGFEGYDATGAWRTTENGLPVDVSGTVSAAGPQLGAFSGGMDFSAQLAASRVGQDCAVLQWLRFSIGRMEGPADACSIADLQARFQANNHSLPGLITDIVASSTFRMRHLDTSTP